jgi:hypothetical protein
MRQQTVQKAPWKEKLPSVLILNEWINLSEQKRAIYLSAIARTTRIFFVT